MKPSGRDLGSIYESRRKVSAKESSLAFAEQQQGCGNESLTACRNAQIEHHQLLLFSLKNLTLQLQIVLQKKLINIIGPLSHRMSLKIITNMKLTLGLDKYDFLFFKTIVDMKKFLLYIILLTIISSCTSSEKEDMTLNTYYVQEDGQICKLDDNIRNRFNLIPVHKDDVILGYPSSNKDNKIEVYKLNNRILIDDETIHYYCDNSLLIQDEFVEIETYKSLKKKQDNKKTIVSYIVPFIPKHNSKTLVFILLFLALVLYVIKKGEVSLFMELVLLSVIGILIIIYFMGWKGNDKLWFLDNVGIIRSAIYETTFSLFVLFFLIQSHNILTNYSMEGGFPTPFIVGIGAFISILPVYVILSLLSTTPIKYTTYYIYITQLIQLAIIVISAFIHRGNLLKIIIAIICYLIIGFAALLLVTQYIFSLVSGVGDIGAMITLIYEGFW